jgi:simple sugar transport system permease protein
MAMAGMAAGAIWGFIPGYLKAKFNVNEIISTLMLNYRHSWVNFWIFLVRRWFSDEPKFQIMPGCRVCWSIRIRPILSRTHSLWFGDRGCVMIILWLIVFRSRWGYEIRLIGDIHKLRNTQALISHGIRFWYDALRVGRLGGMFMTGVVHRRNFNACRRVWFYGYYRGLACKVESASDHIRFHIVWGVDPCWP